MESLRLLCLRSSFSILDALQAARTRECTDPRDKIYATAGLVAQNRPHIVIDPDYTLTAQQVYTRTALDIAKTLGDLDFLCLTGRSNLTSGLPSWVPDWMTNNTTEPFFLFANAGTRHVHQSADPGRLAVKGLKVCSIDCIVPCPLRGSQAKVDPDMRQQIDHFLSEVFLKAGLSGQCSVERSFAGLCRVLFVDDFRNPPRSHASGHTFSECKMFLESFLLAQPYEREITGSAG